MIKILLATGNMGKLKEFQSLSAHYPWSVLSLKDFPDLTEVAETGTTFRENARIKALAGAEKTGLITLADDSGLEVDALGGRPGVYSARFAGEPGDDENNIEKLLSLLAEVPEEKRQARFCCAICVALPQGETFFYEASCPGRILKGRWGSQGFGYDPVFYLPQLGKTMAELLPEEKNLISHRGQAFRGIIPVLLEILDRQGDKQVNM